MNERQEHKLLKTMERLATSMERVADVLETPMVGLPVEGAVELQTVGITWEDAVRVLRETCVAAPACGPGCVMYEWCHETLRGAPAPCEWLASPGAGE